MSSLNSWFSRLLGTPAGAPAAGDPAEAVDLPGEELRGELAEARQRAAGDDAHDPALWNRIGDLHARFDEDGDAAEAWSYALALYEEAGRFGTAAALIDKQLRRWPDRPELLGVRATLRARMGRANEARADLQWYLSYLLPRGEAEGDAAQRVRRAVEEGLAAAAATPPSHPDDPFETSATGRSTTDEPFATTSDPETSSRLASPDATESQATTPTISPAASALDLERWLASFPSPTPAAMADEPAERAGEGAGEDEPAIPEGDHSGVYPGRAVPEQAPTPAPESMLSSAASGALEPTLEAAAGVEDAWSHFRAGDFGAACSAFGAARAHEAPELVTRIAYAESLFEVGRYAEAHALLLAMLPNLPRFAAERTPLHYLLARVEEAVGQARRARDRFALVVASEPGYRDAPQRLDALERVVDAPSPNA